MKAFFALLVLALLIGACSEGNVGGEASKKVPANNAPTRFLTTDTINRGIIIEQISDDQFAAALSFYKARGQPGAPLPVKGGNVLSTIGSFGWTGESYVPSTAIRSFASEDWTPTANGAYIRFDTIPKGTVGGVQPSTERMRITDDGKVGIGTPTPARALHVKDTLRLEPRSEPPADAAPGDIYFDGDLNKPCYFNAAEWVTFDGEETCS